MSFPTSGCIRRCEPAQIVSAAGRVSQWTDVSGAGNDLPQSDAGTQPFDNGLGYVSFDNGAYGFVDSLAFDKQSHTKVIVTTNINTAPDYNAIMSRSGGTGFNFFFDGTNHEFLAFDTKVSTLRCESTPCLVGVSLSAAAVKLIYNNDSQSLAALSAGTESGDGWFGGFYPFGGQYSSRCNMRAVFEWDHELDASEWTALRAYVATAYGINYTKTAQIITHGDSITAGVASTLNLPWQFLMTGIPATAKLLNYGRSSGSLSGVSGTPNLSDLGTSFVDPAFDSGVATNILVIWAGSNDLALGETAAATYALLVAYCNARKAANPSCKIVVATMIQRSGVDNTDYNAAIIAGWQTFADALSDVGALTVPTVDGVHPNDAGEAILAPVMQAAILSVLSPAPSNDNILAMAVLSTAQGTPIQIKAANVSSVYTINVASDGLVAIIIPGVMQASNQDQPAPLLAKDNGDGTYSLVTV